MFVAVLPASAVEGSAGRTLIALRQARRRRGPLRARRRRRAPHAPGRRAARPATRRAPGRPPGGADRSSSTSPQSAGGSGGGAIAAILVGLVLLGLVVGGTCWSSRAAATARPQRRPLEVGEINQTDDFVRLGDEIRALELDITLGDAGRADYDHALAAYARANDLQRKGDEAGANRALDEGLAAIAAARERIAGRR